jgi:hypothetical protein
VFAAESRQAARKLTFAAAPDDDIQEDILAEAHLLTRSAEVSAQRLLPFRFKRIADRETLDLLTVLHILRVQNATAALERASKLQRVVDPITVTLRKR